MNSYSFDGFGINGPDNYKTRVLTLADGLKSDADAERFCKMACAAPEMLAALEYFVICDGDGDWDGNKAVEMAKSAIAKARGTL